MNRHTRIFWGIFCWISVAVCVCLAVANSVATPASETGALIFAAIGAVMIIGGLFFVRDRHRI